MRTRRRKIQLELAFGTAARGEAPSTALEGTEARAAQAGPERPAVVLGPRMEAVVERDNLKKALARVRRNKGAPGIDGMSVDDLAAHLKDHWPEIRARLLDGSYAPQPVRQWKRGRTRFAALRRRGIGKDLAAKAAGSSHGPWRLSNSPALAIALSNAFLGTLGLASLDHAA